MSTKSVKTDILNTLSNVKNNANQAFSTSIRHMTDIHDYWIKKIAFIFLIYTIVYIILFINTDNLFNVTTDKTGKSNAEVAMDAIYFSTTTSSTIGYGDILPIHWGSKLLVSTHQMMLLLITLYSLK